MTVKVADVAPCGTVTEAGTLATEGFELTSITEAPPLGAADVRVIVPVADWPLVSEVLLTVSLLADGVGGVTVTLNVALTP